MSGNTRKKSFVIKEVVKMYSSADLNGIYIICVKCVEVCVQKDLFSSFGLLQRKIIAILKVKNEQFIYNAVTIFTGVVFIETFVFFDYGLVLRFPSVGD